MSKVIHLNKDFCAACAQRLLGCHPALVSFLQDLRKLNPDAHTSCGLRGRAEQDKAFERGNSRAKYGESPHNYGMAIDLFRLTVQTGASFDSEWFKSVVGPAVASRPDLTWGGSPEFAQEARLLDMPHVQLKDWKQAVKAGESKLIGGA